MNSQILRGRRSAALSFAAVAVCGCGAGHPSAPRIEALALAPGLRVVSSVTGPGVVDSATGQHFRYMIITGPRGSSAESLLRTEVNGLENRRWRLLPTRVGEGNGHTVNFGLNAHDVAHGLDGPNGVYAALAYLKDVNDLDHSPYHPLGRSLARLRREIQHGVPMLNAVITNQDN